MALKKISRSYGPAYAFATAVLRTQDGTSRAKVYANSTYALPSADGSCQLDASGTLTVYAEDTSLYQVSLYARSGMVLRTDFNVEAGSGENGVDDLLTPLQRNAGAVAVSGLNANSEFIGVGGELLSFVEATPYVTVTTTTTAFTGACELAGFDVTSVTAGATVTIYDGTSTSGAVVVPTTTLSAVGRTEFNWKRVLRLGCHVVVTGTVSLNVLVG